MVRPRIHDVVYVVLKDVCLHLRRMLWSTSAQNLWSPDVTMRQDPNPNSPLNPHTLPMACHTTLARTATASKHGNEWTPCLFHVLPCYCSKKLNSIQGNQIRKGGLSLRDLAILNRYIRQAHVHTCVQKEIVPISSSLDQAILWALMLRHSESIHAPYPSGLQSGNERA